MFPFKDKLTAEEMKTLVPVIMAFGGLKTPSPL
jgi:hypothetical protein